MKILIADDEDYTREGLIESIPWQEYGIDEIMQAVNGAEALKIAGWFRPDIVLTDIRMPQMDGIAFADRLMRENPDSRIIFMSGYMEIEYLKSAIRLSAVDYIEKPIDLEVVQEALRQLFGASRPAPHTAAMIGDRRFDVEGAKAHQLDSIGVAYGYALPGELQQAGADFVVESVEELTALLMQ